MTNTEAIDQALGDGERNCLWQIVPRELPGDLPPMSLELWSTPDGLRLVQLFVDRKKGRKHQAWYKHIEGFVLFSPVGEGW